MRRIELSAMEYNFFVFPAVGGSSVKSLAEWETALRLMAAVKAPAYTEEVPLTEAELEMQGKGQAVYASRKASGNTVEFDVEEDERKMLVERLKAAVSAIPMVAIDEYNQMLKKIELPQGE